MSRTRICAGELAGCQPRWKELEDIWALSIRGINSHGSDILMTHIINSKEVVREQTLQELGSVSDDPAVLNNLNLKFTQKSPVCAIEIRIGPNHITSVTVEAEDHTWAIGRHTEIMEKLLKTRGKLALGSGYAPEWPRRLPVTLGSLVSGFAKGVVGFVATPLLFLLVFLILGLAIVPPFVAVDSLYHHESIPHGTMIRLPFSVTCIAIIIVIAYMTTAASRSKVVVRAQPFWNSSRTAMIGSIAAAVSALVGVVSILIN
jgi:hypothetical protein